MADNLNNQASEYSGNEKTFEEHVRNAGDTVAETLDRAVDSASEMIGGKDGNRLLGGAAVGAAAAVVLPFSLLTGAIIGAGYAAYRKLNK